jgi:hypothetical protein
MDSETEKETTKITVVEVDFECKASVVADSSLDLLSNWLSVMEVTEMEMVTDCIEETHSIQYFVENS